MFFVFIEAFLNTNSFDDWNGKKAVNRVGEMAKLMFGGA